MNALARTDEQARYWVAHLRTGAWLSLAVAVVALLYVHLTVPVGDPTRLTLVILIGAIPGAVMLCSPLSRIVRRAQGAPLLYAWNAWSVVVIATAALVDGGWQSPLLFFLVLPPIRASIAYPPGGVVACGGLAVLAELVVCVVSGSAAGRILIGCSTLLVVTAGGAAAARNVERRRRREASLGRRLRHLAEHDGLTDLLDRRAFFERLGEQCEVARRDGTGLCLLSVDIDGFKAVNDEQGHPAGDEVLRRIATLLEDAGRRMDVAARIGGDELALMLPGADVAAARRVGEELVCGVRGLDLPLPVTVSIGVAALRQGQSADELTAAADRSLYAAKDAGRDRVGQTGQPS